MMEELRQGMILNVEKVKKPVLIVSKDFFNQTGEIIGCPIFKESIRSPLHIEVTADNISGYVQCEKLALLDLNVRGYSVIDIIPVADIMNITDAVQGIFDYV